jgi:heat shock protein HslJ
VTALFDSEKAELTGSGGCNSYFANYEVDGSNLSIPGPYAVTEMWCGEEKGEQERKFFEILPDAESFKVSGDKLTIDCGGNVLNFEKE